MRIDTAQLRQITSQLLDHLEQTGRSSVELEKDFYWWIEKPDVYDTERDPADLSIGQLHDDWAELTAISEGRRDPLGYALVWLSAIYRYVGEQAVG